MENKEIIEAFNWRYATKKYDQNKKINVDQWELLKKSLHLAPSSYGLQPWRFLVIQNPAIRKDLRKVSWDQSIIEDCSHLVVFTTLKEMTEDHIIQHIEQTARVRGLRSQDLDGYLQFMKQKILIEKPKSDHLEWNRRQAYIAMGFLLETAALLRIDSTPIEGLDPDKYDEILNLKKSKYSVVAAVALGYRHTEDQYQLAAKSRFSEEEIFEVIL